MPSSFWLNGELIFEAEDDRFPSGFIGLAAELSYEGEVGVFVFDDVRIGVMAH